MPFKLQLVEFSHAYSLKLSKTQLDAYEKVRCAADHRACLQASLQNKSGQIT